MIGKTWLRFAILLALNLRICGAATRSSAFVISVLPYGAQCGSARDGAVVYTVLQGESLNEHHPAYEYYQKREHRVMDTLTRAVERDGLADPRRERGLLCR